MPLYAYRCRACGKEFETLATAGETPVCKGCASADLERQLSLIARPANKGGGDAPALAPCGAPMEACRGGGSCAAFADD
jgi:putative FmdB family regulatory protein